MRVPPLLACATILILATACGGGGGGGGVSVAGAISPDDGSTPARPPQDGALPGTHLAFVSPTPGMSGVDREFSVFVIQPPLSTARAQVLLRATGGRPRILDGAAVRVFVEAATDGAGSRNSTSLGGKTDFWENAGSLFGGTLAPGEGLSGSYLPADVPGGGVQELEFDAATGLFIVNALPVTPRDDDDRSNPYPLFRFVARDRSSGEVLAATGAVLPVSSETNCRDCHVTGGIGATGSASQWSSAGDLEVQAKENILLLHDQRKGTGLARSTPVLCSNCHYQQPLDLDGSGRSGAQTAFPTLSKALHSAHSFLGGESEAATCNRCHPGTTDDLSRGVMASAGLRCFDCHGDISDVAGADTLSAGGSIDGSNDGKSRRPFTDLPRCQSCHTGDALDHRSGPDVLLFADGLRLRQAFPVGDQAASPILATNRRFAENPDLPYRDSRGHGGLLCSSCHGAAHAIWPLPDPDANDNVAAVDLQGHAGTVSTCGACHEAGSLPLTTGGPHGMHNVGDARWTDHEHELFFERNPDSCRACHGVNLTGSPLSRTAADRVLKAEDQTIRLPRGTAVGCNLCHGLPDGKGEGENEEEDDD